MTIARELVTRLGFKVDKSGLNTLDRALTGFKNRFVLTSNTVTSFANGLVSMAASIVNTVGDTAKAAVSVKELARNAGIATEEFVKLQRAAAKFGVDEANFNAIIENFSENLREAQTGRGKLFEIMQNAALSGAPLDLTKFVDSNDIQGALVATIDWIKALKDARDQKVAAKDIFQAPDVNQSLRLVEKGSEVFLKAVDANQKYAESYVGNIKAQEEFIQKSRDLKQNVEEVGQVLTGSATSVGTGIVDLANDFFDSFNYVKDRLSGKGFWGGLQYTFEQFKKDLFPNMTLKELQDKQGFKPKQESLDMLKRYAQSRGPTWNPPTTVTNTVQVSVAPGTDVEQQKALAEAVKAEMQSFYDEKNREVISNNPQVE